MDNCVGIMMGDPVYTSDGSETITCINFDNDFSTVALDFDYAKQPKGVTMLYLVGAVKAEQKEVTVGDGLLTPAA